MFLNAGMIAVMIMHIQIVQSQNNVVLSEYMLDEDIYNCMNQLRLICTYTGNTSACCSLTREWKVNGVPVMTDGSLASGVEAGKYAEKDVNPNKKEFKLVINDLNNADLEKSYSCTYNFDDLLTAVTIGETCDCFGCGIRLLGYLSIGSVVNLAATMACFWKYFSFGKDYKQCMKECKRITAPLFFSLFVSYVFNGAISAGVGIYSCLCLDGKDAWLIFGGVLTGCFGTVPAVFIYKQFSIGRYASLLCLLAVVTIGIDVIDLSLIKDYLKGLCPTCGGESYLWAFIGSVVALLFLTGFLCIVLKKSFKRSVIFGVSIWTMSLVVDVVLAVPIGTYLCPCIDWKHPYFIILGIGLSLVIFGVFWLTSVFDEDDCTLNLLLRYAGLVVLSFLFVPIPFLFIYYCCWKDDANSSLKKCLRAIGLVMLAILIFPIPFLIIYFCLEEFFEYTRTNIGSNVQLKCPHKDAIGQINWIRINGTSRITYSEGTSNNLQDLPIELVKRLTVKDRHLFISNVQESDSGIYACELSPEDGAPEPQVAKLQLTVHGGGKDDAVPV